MSKQLWILVLGLWAMLGVAQAESLKPILSDNWLVFQGQRNQLVPYLPGYHEEHQALYQWVLWDQFTNPKIEFAARQELCIYIDNRLIFVADSTARYLLDLSKYLAPNKRHLLTVWHPKQQPNYTSFKIPKEQLSSLSATRKDHLQLKARQPDGHKNALVLFMIAVGFLYGSLRLTFYSDFSSIFRASNFIRFSTLEEGLFAKPIGNWSSILFVLAFALSFALLIVTIHTNIEEITLLNQLFRATQADLISKILLYTLLISLFVIVKYFFLRLMGFIFGVREVVLTQYREFLRTLLAMGVFLPLIMLLYLGLANSIPQLVYWVANVSVTALLIFTVVRVFLTVNKKHSLQNLHLFSYLCATEVIPMMILLKMIVFI